MATPQFASVHDSGIASHHPQFCRRFWFISRSSHLTNGAIVWDISVEVPAGFSTQHKLCRITSHQYWRALPEIGSFP
jgi:hypothetical protein